MAASGGDLATRLRGRAEFAGLAVAPRTAERLAAYVALLLRWNERINLTALDDGDAGLDRLIIEPLAALRHLPSGTGSMIDIGSGGGSPAIPIRIARPGLRLRMVEAKARKAAFLREAVRWLGLDGAVVEHCRHEALRDRPELRGQHDALTMRAVRVDGSVAASLEGLLRPGGAMLLFCSPAQTGVARDFRPPLAAEARRRLVPSGGGDLIVVRKAEGAAPDRPNGVPGVR